MKTFENEDITADRCERNFTNARGSIKEKYERDSTDTL